MDFIVAASNLRAANYSIPPADRHKVSTYKKGEEEVDVCVYVYVCVCVCVVLSLRLVMLIDYNITFNLQYYALN